MSDAATLLATLPPPGIATEISDRLSTELVIALVGPVGSGVSTAAALIEQILISDFDYRVCPTIKPSEIIRREAHRVEIVPPNKQTQLSRYINSMQDAGNKLRKLFGPEYLAEKAVERIVGFRTENGGYSDGGITLPGRRAYIIDSIKNIEELELLRKIYRETLCVIGVFAPDEQRRARLIDNGMPEHDVQQILDRDQSDVPTFGQMTRKVFVESDFFICNDTKKDELRAKVSRYLNIIFDTTIHTPLSEESAMYEASAAAANSACMSRQVGAAIVSTKNELISVGWNDVPKYNGGLYIEDDQSVWDQASNAVIDMDHRCFKWGGNICHNETRRENIFNEMIKSVMKSGFLKRGTTEKQIREIITSPDVDSIIEFSRSIHAEMEAILAVAREGRHSLLGATLYSTTYPCHNCARHIVASGIKKVIYIEPYLKSLATKLHSDTITEDPNSNSKVVFRQYDGVAPRNFLRLFRPIADRKRGGRLFRPSRRVAAPIFRVPLDDPALYESKVIADLSSKEQNP